MCYPQPGPRCYTHARAKLNNAHNRVARAKEVENEGQQGKERMRKAVENLIQAQREYDTTNEGMVELAHLYKEESRSTIKDKYRMRLTRAKEIRKKQDDWAREYNSQKKTKRKAPTQKMKDIEKSIKVVDEESIPFYKNNLDAVKKEAVEAPSVEVPQETVEIQQTKVPEVETKTETPVVQEIKASPKENPNVKNRDDKKRRAEVIAVKSLDSLDLTRPQGRKRLARAERKDNVSPVSPTRVSVPTNKAATEKLESQNGEHHYPVLYDHKQQEMNAKLVSLPHGKQVWEIQDKESVKRIPVASSSNSQTRNRYYAQFGITERIAAVPGKVSYSPRTNGYVVKAA